MGKVEENYWDSEYPTYIEVPEDYWVCSHNVEYTNED
tara:strand:- start:458 stop:568 length:111 start_codon:yes stop_codon:yes gene_type:complete